MSILKRFMSVVFAGAALMSMASAARADQTWNWSYTGDGLTASGTFTTAGAALVAEDILSFSGTHNGSAILGLVPVDTDPSFIYDNQFAAGNPHFTDGGVLFDVGGTHTNVYFFEGQYWEVTAGNPEVAINFNVTAVPEPATMASMGLGLAALAFVARRRKPSGKSSEAQPA